jgi:rhodanese-related sulfurtransferase
MPLMQTLKLFFPALLLLTACSSAVQETNLSVADFEKGIAQNNIQLLDVRTPGEYQSGHLKNALQADWNNEAEFQERVKALNKSNPVYTYCLSGGRSSAATEWLNQNGFKAYSLSGGIGAWKAAGKPVEMATSVKQTSMVEYLTQIPTDKTVLVDISANWCPPCKKMAPVIDSLVSTNGDHFVLVKIDGGDQASLCNELKVAALPTFIIYKQGKEVWRKQGLTEARELISNL